MTHSFKLTQARLYRTGEMPFRSQAQQRWMYANNPDMAKKWQEHTPKGKLPKRVKKKKKNGK